MTAGPQVIQPPLYYEEGTWTPIDASGAALALTVAASNCNYTRIGRMVFASFQVTYPTTADATPLRIGGLPYTLKNTNNAIQGGYVTYTDFSTTAIALYGVNNSTTFLLSSIAGGATYNNLTFSGKTVRGTLVYFV